MADLRIFTRAVHQNNQTSESAAHFSRFPQRPLILSWFFKGRMNPRAPHLRLALAGQNGWSQRAFVNCI